ncbi:MAG: hypothetical protein ACR2RV_19695, partial [Verrucomicrobiales bacterium]
MLFDCGQACLTELQVGQIAATSTLTGSQRWVYLLSHGSGQYAPAQGTAELRRGAQNYFPAGVYFVVRP